VIIMPNYECSITFDFTSDIDLDNCSDEEAIKFYKELDAKFQAKMKTIDYTNEMNIVKSEQ